MKNTYILILNMPQSDPFLLDTLKNGIQISPEFDKGGKHVPCLTCHFPFAMQTGGKMALKSPVATADRLHCCTTLHVLFNILHCCAPLQVLFDFCSVRAIKPLQFFVELGISLIDVVDVCVLVMCPPSAVLGSFLNPAENVRY